MSFLIFLSGVIAALAAVALRGRYLSFRAQRPADLVGLGPDFDLTRHLSGALVCEGVIFGPTGRVSSRFVADMQGDWDGNRGTLTEVFRYDTGRVQHRAWSLELTPDGGIRATAPDVPGEGAGRIEGPGVQLLYRIRLDAEAGGHVLDVTDWMYLMDNGTIMNRSQFRKFGITVAELVATIRPAQARAADSRSVAA